MKYKISWRKLLGFTVFEILFINITAPFMIFYGPFYNLKRMAVGASVTTLKHQYIAKMFLSEKKINEILKFNYILIEEQKRLDQIALNIRNKKDGFQVEKYIIKSNRFKGYAVFINNPNTIKVGYSSKLGIEGETTSKIASKYRAVVAINGGGFQYEKEDNTWIGTGANPEGILISSGKIINNSESNTTKMDIMALTNEGVMLVGKYSLSELVNRGVREAISFGPAVVINGKGTIKRGDGGWGIAPRTAIGQRKDGSIIFLVVDGRQAGSYGATLRDIQDIMLKYGVYSATNLDGGSSSTMYYKGGVMNNPCDPMGERVVPSIIYVEP